MAKQDISHGKYKILIAKIVNKLVAQQENVIPYQIGSEDF